MHRHVHPHPPRPPPPLHPAPCPQVLLQSAGTQGGTSRLTGFGGSGRKGKAGFAPERHSGALHGMVLVLSSQGGGKELRVLLAPTLC